MVSIGIIEISNVSKGYLVCDNILKKTNITMLNAQSVCPGKFLMIFGGEISAVAVACELVRENFSEFLIDIQELGNIDDRVFDALNCSSNGKMEGSLGIIETYSAASCILAADMAIKSANVDIAELRIARGMAGKSYLALTGSISAVTEAVECGARDAKENGILNDTAIIASPHKDLWQYIQ